LPLEVSEALVKGQVLRQLDEANQVAALTAAVAVEEILAGIDIEGRPSLGVQGTESHELGALTRWPASPILLSQVIEQREPVFESFEILAHGAVFASADEPKQKGAASLGKDGGGIEIFQRRRGQRTCRTGVSPDNGSAWGSAGALRPNQWARRESVWRRKEPAGWERSKPPDQRRRVEGSGTRSGSFSVGVASSHEQCSIKCRRSA
jgi:hypothetical protein